jgi:hypothetical protein
MAAVCILGPRVGHLANTVWGRPAPSAAAASAR